MRITKLKIQNRSKQNVSSRLKLNLEFESAFLKKFFLTFETYLYILRMYSMDNIINSDLRE